MVFKASIIDFVVVPFNLTVSIEIYGLVIHVPHGSHPCILAWIVVVIIICICRCFYVYHIVMSLELDGGLYVWYHHQLGHILSLRFIKCYTLNYKDLFHFNASFNVQIIGRRQATVSLILIARGHST